jgi:hypothetical protein
MDDSTQKELATALSATRVTVVERLQSLWGGYGEIVRVRIEGAAFETAVVKCVSPPRADAENPRSHARKLRSYEVELAWYRQQAELSVPACRMAKLHYGTARGGRSLFVLEDLDEAGFATRRSRPKESELSSCLAWLARFHARFLGIRPEGLWKRGTYWHLGTRPDEFEALRHPGLKANAAALDRRLAHARYKTIVHGDAKVQNFCFDRSGSEVAVVDFQYVGPGVGVQDLAYFLDSCLDDRSLERHAPRLVDHYFTALRRALGEFHAEIDAAAVEAEWRTLVSVAWADFYRFLLGWAPGHYGLAGYAADMTAKALQTTKP